MRKPTDMATYFAMKAAKALANGDNAARIMWAARYAALMNARAEARKEAKTAYEAERFEFFESIGLSFTKGDTGWKEAA